MGWPTSFIGLMGHGKSKPRLFPLMGQVVICLELMSLYLETHPLLVPNDDYMGYYSGPVYVFV